MGLFKKRILTQAPRINISLGRKFNLGNYESADIHVSFSRDMNPNETPKDAFDSVFLDVINQLHDKKKEWGIEWDDRFETKLLRAKAEEEAYKETLEAEANGKSD